MERDLIQLFGNGVYIIIGRGECDIDEHETNHRQHLGFVALGDEF